MLIYIKSAGSCENRGQAIKTLFPRKNNIRKYLINFQIYFTFFHPNFKWKKNSLAARPEYMKTFCGVRSFILMSVYEVPRPRPYLSLTQAKHLKNVQNLTRDLVTVFLGRFSLGNKSYVLFTFCFLHLHFNGSWRLRLTSPTIHSIQPSPTTLTRGTCSPCWAGGSSSSCSPPPGSRCGLASCAAGWGGGCWGGCSPWTGPAPSSVSWCTAARTWAVLTSSWTERC